MKIVYSGIDSIYESEKEDSKDVDTNQQEEIEQDSSDTNTKKDSKKDKKDKKDSKDKKEEENALLNGTTIECPECGSTDVNITNDGESFHCSNCEHTWSVRDADDDGLDDDEDEDMIDSMTEELDESTIEKGSFYKQHDGNYIYVVESDNHQAEILDISSGIRKQEDVNVIAKSIMESVTVEDVYRV